MWGLDDTNSGMAQWTSDVDGRAQVEERRRRMSGLPNTPESVCAALGGLIVVWGVVVNVLRFF